MNNPRTILAALDAHLERPTRVILYGRAALALGFAGTDPALAATMDVDAILSTVEMAAIEADLEEIRTAFAANQPRVVGLLAHS